MKLIKYTLCFLLAGASLSAWCATPDQPAPPAVKTPKKASDLFPDSVVAKANGFEVKRSQLDEEVIRFKSQAAGRGQNIPPDRQSELESQILEQIIQLKLILAKATEADKTAGSTLAGTRFDEAKTRLGSEDMLLQRLKAEGLTKDELLSKWTEAATAEAVAKRELKVSVTDDDVKKFYEENPSRFEQPEMVRASHILFGTKDTATGTDLPDDKKAAKRKLAEEILKRARAGEDFAKLAKEYSEDPGSKEKGGEYTFPRGQMVPEFEAAAISLNTNQVSDLVTTSFGYHIIKLSEKIPAKKVELAKVSTEIKDGLTQQAMQKQVPDYIAKLKKEASLEILDEKLKPKEKPPQADAPPLPTPIPAPAGAKLDAK
jgi:parvulin-like peptidyl-prolyl isomerase